MQGICNRVSMDVQMRAVKDRVGVPLDPFSQVRLLGIGEPSRAHCGNRSLGLFGGTEQWLPTCISRNVIDRGFRRAFMLTHAAKEDGLDTGMVAVNRQLGSIAHEVRGGSSKDHDLASWIDAGYPLLQFRLNVCDDRIRNIQAMNVLGCSDEPDEGRVLIQVGGQIGNVELPSFEVS